jgi:glutamate-1-semialdehyde aminotransferase
MQFTKSKNLLERAYRVIPSATQTFSKGPTQWPTEGAPNYLVRGEGAWVWDADGNKFLDYLMALGPIILGYNHPAVNEAIEKQLRSGIVFSQMHPLEVEVAETLVDLIPCAEMVRFAKNGSDATSGAVRAARALTGRDRVAACGYHGWHDWFIGSTTQNKGVPSSVTELTHTFSYNDLPALENLFQEHSGEIAAVIMEPVGVEFPQEGFLKGVRDLCTKNGALLIFDEIVTGFRLALGGAEEVFGVRPDFACLGKAMANGMPLAAVVGRREVMEVFDEIFFSGTFGGEALSLAACQATVKVLREENGLARIAQYSAKLCDEVNKLIDQYDLGEQVRILGYPVRSVVAFPNAGDDALVRRTFLMQQCARRGLLYFCSHIPCLAHGEQELTFTLDVMNEALGAFARAGNNFAEHLAGPPVQAIFRKA